MAADRRKGRRFLPQSLLRSSPTSASLVPVGSGGPSEPHGTCSSGQELAGGVRPGLGPTSPRIPPPAPRDSLLGGGGEAKAEFRGRAQRLDLQPWGEGSWGRDSRGESCSGAVQPPWSGAVALLSSGSEGRAGMEDCETMEDVYMASVETDRGVKEQLHLYDTRGLQEGVELPKHYFSFADGFVLVYSVNNLESFQRVELLKKEIDKFKDKKEVAIVVLGNKIDLSEQRQVDAEVAQQWARSEKVRLWEVTVTDRKTLIEPFTLLASKLSQPQSKSSFPLPGRKNKGNSSSEN
uniref:NFKB inhibitor interacting Ras like 1 n=1 Tax=Sus scrofa TaxID=9823 RepID=A0A8D0U7U9_PIG